MSPENDTIRTPLIKPKYERVNSSRKLHLLLQRSMRYSYRQRCCNCCPTILCEFLFPFIIIMILVLSRYGMNKLADELQKNNSTSTRGSDQTPCSQSLTTPPTSSKDLFRRCFKFPPRYGNGIYIPIPISDQTNIVFQPKRPDIDEVLRLAAERLTTLRCNEVTIGSQDVDDDTNINLLRNTTVNTVIVDFSDTKDLKNGRNLAYNIVARTPNAIINNAPIDTSFISYKHPTFIADRTNATDDSKMAGSELPEFTDLKIFVDSLLMEYQTNRSIDYELQRTLMACSPYRHDLLFDSGPIFDVIIFLIDAMYIIPYLILLTSLIREKNAKVKEILKVLGIEPILNNFAQALRTIVIYLILIIILCIVYKLGFKPYAYFGAVNFGVLFIANLIYAIQLTSFCIMNAQLFNSVVRGIIFTFGSYIVVIILISYTTYWPPGIQYLLMFICPYFTQRSLLQQSVLHNLAEKDIGVFQTIYRHVPMYFPTLIVALVSSVLYWALSWYLEKVFPGEFGVPQNWNFLFKLDYWRPVKSGNDTYAYDNRLSTVSNTGRALERSGSIGSTVVHVDHLVKSFGSDKIAVNDVSFDLYENQITSLLGPNGSGKTTIFNCLIGIYKQTSGTITMVNEHGVNYDTRHNIDVLRKSIGYCPQHDILFDLLTIEEQLQFYASARGFGSSKEQISNEMLHLVRLENSKNAYCNSLSGGMKRRLSLACAFVGDTKIVLLDEPSSGLDPSNRRSLWDWLRAMKEGKTLLLTTHFMEESDALSDRIMIISNGVIKADGTSARLKEEYGSGYKLVINKQPEFQTKQIEDHLRTYLPQINVESDASEDGDVVFRANQHPDEQFVQALRQLDIMRSNNSIKNYGVQNSTMDDVFLKITRDAKDINGVGAAIDVERIDEQCRHVFDNAQFTHGFGYYLSQLYGLTMKTLLVRYRRWGLTLVILLLPIVYNLVSNLISRNENATGTFRMKANALGPQTIIYGEDSWMEKYLQSAVKSNDVVWDKRSENISQINAYIKQKRTDRPYTYTDIYLAFQSSEPQNDNYQINTLSSNLITGYEAISVASDIVYKHVSANSDASIETTLIYKHAGNFSGKITAGAVLNILSLVSCFLKVLPTSLILDVFVYYLIFFYTIVFLTSERKDSFLSLLNISGLHPAFYWIFNYVFDVIGSVIWFCYILAVYCIFDVAFNGSPNNRATSEGITSVELDNPWDLRIQFYPLTIIITLPTLPFVYLLSKLFKSDILCGLAVLFLLIIIHLISLIVPIVLGVVADDSIQYLIYWILNIISPSINAQAIITYFIAKDSQYCARARILSDTLPFVQIGENSMAWNWVILICHAVFLLLLLIVIDSGLIRLSCFTSSAHSKFNENELDSDVLAERHRVLSLDPFRNDQHQLNTDADTQGERTDHLTVHDLVKRYSRRNVLAVNHLTFGAKRGEAFGLLGYNGAGKTTTFRILVGDETATHGTAYIDGQNIARRLKSIRRLGYCPQEDCSMEFLTVRDGLYLLARIRGVDFGHIHSVVQTITTLFLLDPFRNNYIHQLSGGTKRRLHAALALIGPPLVAILDEPTTGVDPDARQQMQEVFLNAVKAKLTIILTSHSMDECERVCNRLGIMFNGQLACLGTIQHLKSKFGQGYIVEIKVRSTPGDATGAAMQNVEAFLLSQAQYKVQIREVTHSTGSFQVQHGTPADLFELLEQNKRHLNIETYTISQTTLEQIFLSFGKQSNAI